MIEDIPIEQIKPNDSNPRYIKDKQFDKLVNSIKEFPKMLRVRPIIVNTDKVILGGNMRYMAAYRAGMKTVPVMTVNWTEEQQREFIIKDNLAAGDWDWEILANEWDADELSEWGLDVPVEKEPTEPAEEEYIYNALVIVFGSNTERDFFLHEHKQYKVKGYDKDMELDGALITYTNDVT